jgi:hypothetical protein
MAHYNNIRVKQNWRLISALFVIPFNLIIALLCFVDHDGITNCGGNLETCHDNIVVLITNVVFKSFKNNVDIWNSANDNFILGGTRLHSKALSCIPRHSLPFQGTRLHSQGLNFDSNTLSMEGHYESANRQGRLRSRIT